MKVYQDKSTLIKNPYRYSVPSRGIFSDSSNNNSYNWTACREIFHVRWGRAKIYFQCSSNQQRLAAAKFLRSVEKLLNLDGRSKLYKGKDKNGTSLEGLLVIKSHAFWTKYRVRKEFLSIVLRAGATHNEKDIITRLQSTKYGTKSKPAVELFMRGYTIPQGSLKSYCAGWCREFNNLSKNQVKRRLKKGKK